MPRSSPKISYSSATQDGLAVDTGTGTGTEPRSARAGLEAVGETGGDRHQHDHDEQHNSPGQIKGDRPNTKWRNDPPHEFQWGVCDAVRELNQHQYNASRAPVSIDDLHHIDDKSCPHEDEEQQQRVVQRRKQYAHGVGPDYCWAKKEASISASESTASPATST